MDGSVSFSFMAILVDELATFISDWLSWIPAVLVDYYPLLILFGVFFVTFIIKGIINVFNRI